jgi:Rrf2 family protein
MFNQKTKNAIRIVCFLFENQVGNKKYGAIEIAKELELKSPFISKILQELARKSIISSTKGRGGGFYLSDKNKKKTIKDVIDIFEDHNKIYNCILGLPDCSDDEPCILHHIYKGFRLEIGSFLEKNIQEIILK